MFQGQYFMLDRFKSFANVLLLNLSGQISIPKHVQLTPSQTQRELFCHISLFFGLNLANFVQDQIVHFSYVWILRDSQWQLDLSYTLMHD